MLFVDNYLHEIPADIQMLIITYSKHRYYDIYVTVSTNSNLKKRREFVSKSMHKKIRLPHVPAFMMKLMFGEMAAILLEGSRVSNEKIKKEGFSFVYDDLDEALKKL